LETVQFVVKDVFNITGRGLVLMGRLESGVIKLGDNLFLVGDDSKLPITIVSIEKFRHTNLTEVTDGSEDYGLQVRGIRRDQVKTQDIVTNG